VSVTTAAKSLLPDLLDFMRRAGLGRGDRLPSIPQLATALGFGRNAIRDGLLEAQSHGFVKIEPRHGVYVQELPGTLRSDNARPPLEASTSVEGPNLFHLVDARIMVEVELAGEAARLRRPEDLLPLRQALEAVLAPHHERMELIQADEAFHLTLARIVGNFVLTEFLQSLLVQLRPAKLNVLLSHENRERTDREHRALFQALVDANVEQARCVMQAHVGQGRALLLAYARTLPEAHASVAEGPPSLRSKNSSAVPLPGVGS